MECRHQVFISSTSSDLAEERAEIMQALLELDCIPSGMELFPAATEGAWNLIKGVIDDSDYYCLVIAGRYGSLDSTGISYTEKEYDYAVSKGKPLIAFLHKDPGKIAKERSESTEAGRKKLAAFRKRVEAAHHCKYWLSAEELGGQVSRSFISLRKTHPSDGWVPGKYAADEKSRIEFATLRARVAELEAEIAKKNAEATPLPFDTLASGSDIYTANISATEETKARQIHKVNVNWDLILRYVGPSLIGECSDEVFREKLVLCFFHAFNNQTPPKKIEFGSVIVPHVVVDQIKIQLRALGYMTPGTKRRTVSDKKNYWKLTHAGESRLISAQALGKPMTAASMGLGALPSVR